MKKFLFLSALLGCALGSLAQSTTSGDVSGTLTDPTGALISNAKVTLLNTATGETKTVTSGTAGTYRVALLSPGTYKVTASAANFSTVTNTVVVAVGSVATDNLTLQVGQSSTTIEVSAAAALLNTDNADISTVFTSEQIDALPNPGNDLTFVAQTAPGSVMNTGTAAGGYGNFSSFGISGLSNMFTLDGGYENDPFLNLNNTGASNLTLGNNEVETVTIVSPAYSSQFGGLGGAQVNEITASGANHVHGKLNYYWNGRALNANDFFNKKQQAFFGQQNIPTFVNANQWGAAIGGPAVHDKLFWFINTEGIRAVTPQNGIITAPNTLAQNCGIGADPGGIRTVPGYGKASGTGSDQVTYTSCATLNAMADLGCITGSNSAQVGNLCDGQPFFAASATNLPLLKTIFGVYNNNPLRTSTPVQNVNDPSTVNYNAKNASLLTEWLLTARVDWKIGAKDSMYIHYKQDKGVQPTSVDLVDPRFSANSVQPAWEGQISESHVFSSSLVNQLVLTGNYYSAPFQNTNNYSPVAPFTFAGISGTVSQYGGSDYAFPQGRRVAGYQIIDDVSYIKGVNTLRVGYNIRRDNVTTLKGPYTVSPLGEGFEESFFGGTFDYAFIERFPVRPSEPISVYNEGLYIEDAFKVTPKFTVTAGVRVERNSNPVCHTRCFSDLALPTNSLPTGTASTTTPYSAASAGGLILGNRYRAFTGYQKASVMPRVALNWQVSNKTVVRGGFGMFTDTFPALIADTLSNNLPNQVRPTVFANEALGNGLFVDINPSSNSSGQAIATAAANAFKTGFPTGGTYTSIRTATLATSPYFAVPSFTTAAPNVKYPTYEEYSLGLEQTLDARTKLSVIYVGNHGYHEPVQDGSRNLANPTFGAGIPTARPVTALNTITNVYSGASSNFNGVVASVARQAKGLSMQFNYQFSKSLDEISNGGLEPFAPDAGDSAALINPANLHSNYGPADYNVKHNVTANFVYSLPRLIRGGGKLTEALVGGFQFTGAVFHQSGLPYSITQSTTGGGSGIKSSFSSGGVLLLARQLNTNFDHHCGGAQHVANPDGSVPNPCNFVSAFGTPTGFTQQGRNSLIGPSYSNVDFGGFKTFGIGIPYLEGAKLKVGAQAFNLFNHTNFQNPAHARGSNNSGLGALTGTVGSPTSILGSVGAADASPRLIQLHASLIF